MPNKDNSGALFKEEKKTEKHPDYKGSCLVNGEQMYIAAWINESKNGKKYMSLSFTAPSIEGEYKKVTSTSTQPPAFGKPTESDVPF
tara:strand:+ start:770 stop:1030 length:261 start_codon:yes stop_codon:yes gene_type:complete